jgi:hypothetical protein
MNFDWNWFFSSFCQSAAALIGIIAAFVISRLLGLNEKVNNLISTFDGLLIEFNKIKSSLSNRRFYWHASASVKYNSKLQNEIKNGLYDGLSKEEQIQKVYDCVSGIYKITDAVEKSFNEIFQKLSPKSKKVILEPIELLFPPKEIFQNLSEEKEKINFLEIESRTLIELFKQNYISLKNIKDEIKPLKIIIVVLMFGFTITVIYPLHFMPVVSNTNPDVSFNLLFILKSVLSLKTLLLFLFFITIEGLFGYFLFMINSIEKRLDSTIFKNNQDYKIISFYSEYFE